MFLIPINASLQLLRINTETHLSFRNTHTQFPKYLILKCPYWKIQVHSPSKYSSKWPCPLNTHSNSYTQLFCMSPKCTHNYPGPHKYGSVSPYAFCSKYIYNTLSAYTENHTPPSIMQNIEVQKHSTPTYIIFTSPIK